MKVTVTLDEPNLLLEARQGDVFITHMPDLQELVLCTPSLPGGEAGRIDVIVLGCRVDADEPGYRPPGEFMTLSSHTPITFLELVTPATFRARDQAMTQEQLKALLQRLNDLQAQHLPM